MTNTIDYLRDDIKTAVEIRFIGFTEMNAVHFAIDNLIETVEATVEAMDSIPEGSDGEKVGALTKEYEVKEEIL